MKSCKCFFCIGRNWSCGKVDFEFELEKRRFVSGFESYCIKFLLAFIVRIARFRKRNVVSRSFRRGRSSWEGRFLVEGGYDFRLMSVLYFIRVFNW